MGVNKALIQFDGIPLIQRIAGRLRGLSDDLYVTGSLPVEHALPGLPLYPDVTAVPGALGGLVTALHHARYPAAAVVACDLPFVSPALLEAEAHLLDRLGADIVVPRTVNGLEPLLAVYRVSRCLPAARQSLESGKQRMVSWFEVVKVHEMDEETVRQYDPDLRSFININTPDDLQQALLLAKTQD